MEPVTHLLTGACLARTGLNRRAAYATATMIVAAEFPDIDTLWGVRGPVAAFEHHRGITHTFLGLPFEAALLVLAAYSVHRWRVAYAARLAAHGGRHPIADPLPSSNHHPANSQKASADRRKETAKPLTAAPIRWGWLYGLALLALLSHLLLDYTNNYGLRPFYPFNPHWYAGSIVFIFDPVMFAMLLAGLVAPAIFGLVSAEVGVRKQTFRGRGWAAAALLGVVALWALRAVEHRQAVQMSMSQSVVAPAQSSVAPAQNSSVAPAQSSADGATGSLQPGEEADTGAAASAPPVTFLMAQRVLANPSPFDPFHWDAVIDFGPVYRLAEIDTRNRTVRPADAFQPKPGHSRAVLAAEASPLGRFYINWSPMPFIETSHRGSAAVDSGGGPEGEAGDSAGPGTAGLTVVTFRDPRFMGPIPLLRDSGPSDERTPLSATVVVDAAGRVVRQSMGDSAQP